MSLKQIVFAAHRRVEQTTSTSFKRAHIYELLAAAFGYESYAALTTAGFLVPTETPDPLPESATAKIAHRCLAFQHLPDTADAAASCLVAVIADTKLTLLGWDALIADLRGEPMRFPTNVDSPDPDDEHRPIDRFSSGTLEAIMHAARAGRPEAHYVLALVYAVHEPEYEFDDDQAQGSEHWYKLMQAGRLLTGAPLEWATAFANRQTYAKEALYHLREAGRLNHPMALFDLAARHGDPTFFEGPRREVQIDPMEIAVLAADMQRPEDALVWLNVAAQAGNTAAMRELIEGADHHDQVRCWTWIYLSRLVGDDLTVNRLRAYHDNGDEYDDDVGGTLHVGGEEGIDLPELDPERMVIAKRFAHELFAKIEREASEDL